MKGRLSCPSTSAMVATKSRWKMILICWLSSGQLQFEEKEIQSWPLRFASGLVDLLQTRGKKAGLIMKRTSSYNLVPEPGFFFFFF